MSFVLRSFTRFATAVALSLTLLPVSYFCQQPEWYYDGRSGDPIWGAPSPRCCTGSDCVKASSSDKNVVATSLRSNSYVPLLEEFECSLSKTNPDMQIILLTVKADNLLPLPSHLQRKVKLIELEEFMFPNSIKRGGQSDMSGYLSFTWIKLRVWELVQYDAILFVDLDVTFLGRIDQIMNLPTDFAAVLDEARGWNWRPERYASLGSINSGVMFIRPCTAVAKHMQQMASNDTKLQFQDGMGEQDYLDWYFKFTRWILPGEYNSLDVTLWTHDDAGQLVNTGGVKPIIVHHGTAKPFEDRIEPKRPTHKLLCRHHKSHG